MHKILVPTDFSQPSTKALEKAIELAKTDKSEIIVMHVLTEWWLSSGFTGEEGTFRSPLTGQIVPERQYTREIYGILKKRAKESMELQIRPYNDAGIKIRSEVVLGHPVEKIVELAEQEHVDLIVIGNVGLGGLSKLRVLGSVSRGISELSQCPVMIVKSHQAGNIMHRQNE